MINSKKIREDFPIFRNSPNLIYFDNAATTQCPQMVIDRLSEFYSSENSNIHRGVYSLSALATSNYDSVRKEAAEFINAPNVDSIAFTSGTTEAINMIAKSFIAKGLKASNNIVVSEMEHHANFIPWQVLCESVGAEFRVVPVNENGDLDISNYERLIDKNTALVAITHISNSLGTINPIKSIAEIAQQHNSLLLVDGAQSACLHPIDVEEMDCDFFVFSGHKTFGPFGVGVLYCKPELRARWTPYNYGGGIIEEVSIRKSLFLEYPIMLEAGTPNVAGVIGLGAALKYINQFDKSETSEYVSELADYCREQIKKKSGLNVIANPKRCSGIVSFTVDSIHPHDVASMLSNENIALRAGHHCTQPLINALGLSATLRASFSIYNSKAEIDRMIKVLGDIQEKWA